MTACPAALLPKSVPAGRSTQSTPGLATVRTPMLGRAWALTNSSVPDKTRRAAGVVVGDMRTGYRGVAEDDRAAADAVDHG